MQFNLVGNLFEAAQSALSENRLPEAESLCRQALQLDPRNLACLFLMGVIAGAAGQPAAALGFFDQVAAIDPNLAEAQENRGVALTNLGRPDEAETAFRRAIALAPARAEPWGGLGNLKLGQGDHEGAREAFQRGLELNPQDARAWVNMAIALHHLGRLDEEAAARARAASLLPPRP